MNDPAEGSEIGKRLAASGVPEAADPDARLLQKARELQASSSETERDELLSQIARMLTGTSSLELAHVLMCQIDRVQGNAAPVGPKDATNTSTASLTAVEPKTFTEAMLATQMIQVHHAMSEFLVRATHRQQNSDAVDRNVNRAVRLGRLFTEQIEALQKLRGLSGQQKVTVEHVHVHDGGQAIVGVVEHRTRGRRRK